MKKKRNDVKKISVIASHSQLSNLNISISFYHFNKLHLIIHNPYSEKKGALKYSQNESKCYGIRKKNFKTAKVKLVIFDFSKILFLRQLLTEKYLRK